MSEEYWRARTPASCSPDVAEELRECLNAVRDSQREASYNRDVVTVGFQAFCSALLKAHEAADALESMMRREDAMRSALESIAQHDVGLQALIEDGKDTPKNVASYYASQVERRRKIARAVLEGAPVKEGN